MPAIINFSGINTKFICHNCLNSSIFFQEPSSVEKIMEIDEHIVCAMSGLIADARTLVEHARVETQVLMISYCCNDVALHISAVWGD